MSAESSDPYKYDYQGTEQPHRDGETDDRGRVYHPYLPAPNLREVVNLAIALEKPLLLEGEPGCGKTRLAGAIAYEYTQRYRDRLQALGQEWWDFHIWSVNSTTRAVDGKYRYDAIARLRDAQLMGASDRLPEKEAEELQKRLFNREAYRDFGALGRAFRDVHENGKRKDYRSIVLIDEIDKADSDFPNDLLLELDDMRFTIPETGEEIVAKHKPIIIITSNREKPLSQAFLRRCLYYYVPFPNGKQLRNIIKSRFEFNEDQDALVQEAMDEFDRIRQASENNPNVNPPGTSAFLDFLTALLHTPPKPVEEAREDLQNLANHYPLLSTLFKTKDEQKFYQEQVSRKGRT
ncbi:MAG: MoxR family ATPase [Synechococcales cyanobacterium K44_A2020_017]|nr:MoxR family ATPase [Synechococcales cyanobacterium K32_A2020_035]MBF2093452.1 MoxR family ATPase [Synechococcales cyanobacterium K44_A2020_017]